jgi:hypothetical protein
MLLPPPVVTWIRRACVECVAIVWFATGAGAVSAQPIETTPPRTVSSEEWIVVSDQKTTTTNDAVMAASKKLTTKVLAIGSWTSKGTPESRPAIMPAEARDTMRLMLAGKIDQWFAKSDGSGAVFLMNVTSPAEAHELLENLPLGRADMMRFELIPVGPLWPLGLLHE